MFRKFREWLAKKILGYDFVSKTSFEMIVEYIIDNNGNKIHVVMGDIVNQDINDELLVVTEDYTLIYNSVFERSSIYVISDHCFIKNNLLNNSGNGVVYNEEMMSE